MTRPHLAAALIVDAIVALNATVRSSAGAQGVSTRRRALFVAPPPVGVPARWRMAPGSRRDSHSAAAETPDVLPDKDFNTCRKSPARNGLVKVSLKPDTNVDDLVVWISSITCRQFVWSEAVAARNKKVTIVAPLPMTTRQAFGLFLNALDSIGLTVEPSGSFWRIVETHKVKSTPVPLYGFDGRRLPG
jgi:hypothetical protein